MFKNLHLWRILKCPVFEQDITVTRLSTTSSMDVLLRLWHLPMATTVRRILPRAYNIVRWAFISRTSGRLHAT